MNGFLYFIPKAQVVNAIGVRELDIGGIDEKHYEQAPINSGPDGGAGVMIYTSGHEAKLAYNKAAQTWFPGPDKKYYLGFETATPPGPDDLKRERTVPGVDVEMGDGRMWHCPTARHHAFDNPPLTLPQKYGLDGEGQAVMTVAPSHAGLWETACKAWTAFADGTFTFADEFAAACESVATNYRVGELEIRALGLIQTDSQSDILRALLDLAGAEALLAEVEESGAEGNVPDTGSG